MHHCWSDLFRELVIQEEPASEASDQETETEKKRPVLVLSFLGEKGNKVIKVLNNKLPEKIRPTMVYKGTKLSAFFPAKDKVDDAHCSNLVYHYRGSGGEQRDDYTGETKCRLRMRIEQHQKYDKESAIYQNFSK